MFKHIKNMALSKSAELLQSPTASKILESEKFGMFLEKAISVPVKVSGVISTQKQNIVSIFELATQNDIDELKRNLLRIESVLRDIKNQSGEFLGEVKDTNKKGKSSIAK